jgi:excisionase family DNA binding protein
MAAAKHVKNTTRNRLLAGNGRRWASIDDAAAYLGIHPRTVRKLAAQGRLTLYRNGPRLVRVDLNEVDAMLTPGATA